MNTAVCALTCTSWSYLFFKSYHSLRVYVLSATSQSSIPRNCLYSDTMAFHSAHEKDVKNKNKIYGPSKRFLRNYVAKRSIEIFKEK